MAILVFQSGAKVPSRFSPRSPGSPLRGKKLHVQFNRGPNTARELPYICVPATSRLLYLNLTERATRYYSNRAAHRKLPHTLLSIEGDGRKFLLPVVVVIIIIFRIIPRQLEILSAPFLSSPRAVVASRFRAKPFRWRRVTIRRYPPRDKRGRLSFDEPRGMMGACPR